jgi:hypothetical protein
LWINAAATDESTPPDFIAAYFGADAAHRLFHVVGHVPVAAAGANVMHKALHDRLALKGVGDLWVELHAIESARLVSHAGERRRRVGGNHLEARRQFCDLVAVAHPHIEQAVAFIIAAILDVAEQSRMALGADFRIAEFTLAGRFNLAPQLRRHGLHAVADAQDRYAQFEHGLRHARGFFLVNGTGPARQNDAFRLERADELVSHIVGVQFAIDAGFPDAPGDELGVLGTEVEDEYFFV